MITSSKSTKKKFKITPLKVIKFFIYLFIYCIIIYLVSILLFDILFQNTLEINSIFYKFSATFFILFWTAQIIGSLEFNYLTILVYYRTKYKGYLFEGLTYSSVSAIAVILIVIFFVQRPGFIWLLWLNIVELVFALQYPYLKKPIIWDQPYHRRFINYPTTFKSDIILRQSLFIEGQQDGYSSRPAYLDFSAVINQKSSKFVKEKALSYAKFLAFNGDLIGYDSNENKINLYLRTSYVQRTEITRFVKLFKKIKQIIKKENLTMITFDFTSNELIFKLSESEYSGLNDVTYHELVQRILQQFKLSLEKFLEGKYIESYEDVMPENIKQRSLIRDDYVIAILIIGYIFGIFFIGSTYFYYAKILTTNTIQFNIIYAICWPLITYGGLQIFFGMLTGDSNQQNYYQYVPIVIFVHILTIILTLIFSYFILRRKRLEIINDPNKGIKIPYN